MLHRLQKLIRIIFNSVKLYKISTEVVNTRSVNYGMFTVKDKEFTDLMMLLEEINGNLP
ncbi:MAG: hypothetical protein KAS32_14525 [Candidatus Peribacteraceae bacterium]|nr:hypothetical protein [Candidatus Peribacteraceae bacterium]